MKHFKYSVPYKETSSNEVRFCCPKCGDANYHLYYNPLRGLYLCFKCNYRGKGFPDAIKAVKFQSTVQPIEKPIREISWNPLKRPSSGVLEETVWDYLYSRNVSDALISQFNIGWSFDKPFTAVFPISMNHQLKCLQVRNLIRDIKPKYVFYDVGVKTKKSELIYNYDTVVLGVETLYIMEGVLDVICAAPTSGVCTFGKAVSFEQAKLIHGIPKKKLVLAYDPEVSAKELMISVHRLEIYEPVFIKQLPPGKDPGDLGPAFLQLPEIPSFDWIIQQAAEKPLFEIKVRR